MINWKNMDTLAAYGELQNAKPVNVAAMMSGENGAERVRNYTVPMGAGLNFNFGSRPVNNEILKVLVAKGKGLEMNTSGVDRCGGFLPTADYFRRFRELGGEIVTVGSDAHRCDRVGQYSLEACEVLKDIFGYVCTFEDRKPIFHKL